ncbi:MAG TPA: DUF2147 domain-containing protein [Beijerinckiaceae bacterium]|jgi:uncharacterized protein (DUF2147 family)
MTKHALAALTGAFALLTAGAALAQEPTGTWLSQSGETRVRIGKCGAAMCGTIVGVKGEAKDANNPDPNLRGRSLVGVQMISNIQPSGEGTYTGSLYNPQDGKVYTGKMRLKGANALELSGCVMGVFCKSQTWSKVN